MSDQELGRAVLRQVPSLDSYLVSTLVSAIVVLLVYGQIAKRAGFSRWWSLTLLVPGLAFVMPIVFAMIRWPVERKRGKKS